DRISDGISTGFPDEHRSFRGRQFVPYVARDADDAVMRNSASASGRLIVRTPPRLPLYFDVKRRVPQQRATISRVGSSKQETHPMRQHALKFQSFPNGGATANVGSSPTGVSTSLTLLAMSLGYG